MTSPTADVVIVAAGASSRMGGVDKLSTPVAGRPLIAWTVGAFARVAAVRRIVLVSAADRADSWRDASWLPAEAIVVRGGPRRQESVVAGVRALGDGTDVVLVHDGARPAASTVLIERVIEATVRYGAAIPVVPVVETLKRIDGDRIVATVDRAGLGAAQTPQGVRLGILRDAWARFPPDGADTFTDEAGLLEACTIPVHVVPGQPDNLKVTVPADLARVAAILADERPRIGYGEDTHPFGPGAALRLGGIEFAGAPRLHGHSDGDVVLHAVASALLGAAGLPDLGQQFPADARTPEGIDSAQLVAEVVHRVHASGFEPVHVDVTIVGGRPRLSHRLDAIRTRVAQLAGLPVDSVSAKASTGNLSGPEGAGRAISARVVASVERRR